MKELNRRKFFNRISIGALGAILLSSLPFNLFGKTRNKNVKKVKVKINPSSVKRNK